MPHRAHAVEGAYAGGAVAAVRRLQSSGRGFSQGECDKFMVLDTLSKGIGCEHLSGDDTSEGSRRRTCGDWLGSGG